MAQYRDYNTIMSRAIKAGPLLMKIKLMRWRKVTAAVFVSETSFNYLLIKLGRIVLFVILFVAK